METTEQKISRLAKELNDAKKELHAEILAGTHPKYIVGSKHGQEAILCRCGEAVAKLGDHSIVCPTFTANPCRYTKE